MEASVPVPIRMRTSSNAAIPRSTSNKYIFALVGLPARGKSFIASKIVSFFNWSGTSARIFNAGSKRRDMEGAAKSGRSAFFCNSNASAVSKRDEIALATLDEAINWLIKEDGCIALFDATNTTQARRHLIQLRMDQMGASINLIFVESICTNEEVLKNNLIQKIRHSPDFDGISEEEALEDLRVRIASYERVYEPVSDDEEVAYIKVIDFHSKVICYQVFGAIPLRCVQLLMSSHVGTRPVYLIRSGHCDGIDDMNRNLARRQEEGVTVLHDGACVPKGYKCRPVSAPPATTAVPVSAVGVDDPHSSAPASHSGLTSTTTRLSLLTTARIPSTLTCNAHLSEQGKRFGRRVRRFFDEQNATTHAGVPAVPFTSTTTRAVETAEYLPLPPSQHQQWSALNILDTGICHGLSVATIRDEMPAEFEKWKTNPFLYRFPGGESTLDMNRRLAEVVLEIERLQEPAIVVSHLSTLQSLVAYFTSLDVQLIPFVSVPQHCVIVLTPNIYGWSMNVIKEEDLPDVP